MKKIICLILSLVMILLAVFTSSAFTLQKSGVYKSADDSGAYVIHFSGTHADIQKYTSQNDSIGLNLSYTISAVCTYNDKVVLFCSDIKNNQLIVYVYDFNTEVTDSFAIYGAKIYNNTDFCCTDSGIYIENSQDERELKAYSYSGSVIGNYHFDEEITSVFGGYRSGVFAVSGDTLYSLSGNKFTEVSGTSVEPPLFHAGSDVIASAYGKVYVLSKNRVIDTFTVDTDYSASSASVIGNRLYYSDGSTIYGYDIDTGKKVSYFKVPFTVRLLYGDTNGITAVGDNSYTTIRTSDFTEIRNSENNNGDDDNTDNHPNGSQTNGNHTALKITSDIYRIDWENYYISGIAPDTTVAEFKKNMNYDGYTLTIYRDNSVKKSGNVGTAMTAVFTFENTSYTFELSVEGDITGEGNRNSRDLTLLMDYLIGAADFNGVYSLAADISADGVVDVVDAAVLKSLI